MGGDVHIALVADDRYRPGMETTRASMVRAASDPGRLVFHLFGESEIRALDAEIRRDLGTYKGSSANFVRLYLARLLPDVDWIIYSDVDTIWLRDPCELWKLRDPDRTVQWVRDLESSAVDYRAWCASKGITGNPNYACSGVMLINLAAWRRSGALDRCREFVRRYGVPASPDQDLLNTVLAEEAGMLPAEWDVLVPERLDAPSPFSVVMHISGAGERFHGEHIGKVLQFKLWHQYRRVLAGEEVTYSDLRSLARIPMPFCPSPRFIRMLLPFASELFRMRVRRVLAYNWLVRQRAFHEAFARSAAISR